MTRKHQEEISIKDEEIERLKALLEDQGYQKELSEEITRLKLENVKLCSQIKYLYTLLINTNN